MALAVVAGLVVVGSFPTNTRVGIDYAVEQRFEPLAAKAIAFVYRDAELRALADRVAGGESDEERLVQRVLGWSRANVRQPPPGWPVVDDHVLHVAIRGYGTYDQAADLFATIAAYAGVPATLVFTRPPGASQYAFALARVGGIWRVYDPHGVGMLSRADGAAATAEELRARPETVDHLGASPVGTSYRSLVAELPPVPPQRLRPYDQMLLHRPLQELAARLRR